MYDSLFIRKLTKSLLAIFLIVSFILCGCSSSEELDNKDTKNGIIEENTEIEQQHNAYYVEIKYSYVPVDINDPRFEYLNTEKSSFINGAWYDIDMGYMVIKLNDTYYHYCGLPESIWTGFINADSFGEYYNAWIKGNYACR